jgi:hypothetical protein
VQVLQETQLPVYQIDHANIQNQQRNAKQQIARLLHQPENVNQFQALTQRPLPFVHNQQMDALQETQHL